MCTLAEKVSDIEKAYIAGWVKYEEAQKVIRDEARLQKENVLEVK